MYYLTVQNAYGQRALYRCWPTSAGFISSFIRYIADARCDTD